MVDVEMAAVLPARNGFLSVFCSILRKFRLVYHNEISLPYFVYGRTFESEIPFLNGIIAECSVNLHPEPVQQTSSSDLPLIVFCVNSTRVGTDVAAALRNCEAMYGNRMVIMVVMNHFPRQAAYTNPHSHVHVQQNNVLATYDCFFSENEGLHSCNENREAIKVVARLILMQLPPPQYRLNKLVFASYIGFGVALYLCRRIFIPVSGRQ